MRPRHLVLVLGDQLDAESAAFDGFDPHRDAILQMEVREEATYVPQHKRRLAFFFAAMPYLLLEFRSVLLPSQSQARTHLHPTTTIWSIRSRCTGSQGTIGVLEIFF